MANPGRASIEAMLFFRLFPILDALTQEATLCDETISGSQSPLLNLPAELREHVYRYVFHKGHFDDLPCNIFLEGRGDSGCWCGNGVSLTSHQMYNETRCLFYSCVRLIFPDPLSCEHFFRNFGKKAEWVTSLKVTYENIFSQAYLFQDIFRYIGPNSNLRTLELQVLSLDPDRGCRPIYCPSLPKYAWAARYDLALRPARHPLTKMKYMTSLTVVGHPTMDMEEAIFKLSLEMEERAMKEGKVVEVHEGVLAGTHREKSDRYFNIKILEKASESASQFE